MNKCYLISINFGKYAPMLRLLDISLSFFGLFFLSPVFLIIFFIGVFSESGGLFFQTRVGINQRPFVLVKFRTMPKKTLSVASHLICEASITKWGRFLRRTKLDEIPQLWNVLKGDMSLVGPRPNLYSQTELIAQRQKYGVYVVRPGITGLAQINKIDMSNPSLLAKTDHRMMVTMSVKNYFIYILGTVLGKGRGDRVKS